MRHHFIGQMSVCQPRSASPTADPASNLSTNRVPLPMFAELPRWPVCPTACAAEGHRHVSGRGSRGEPRRHASRGACWVDRHLPPASSSLPQRPQSTGQLGDGQPEPPGQPHLLPNTAKPECTKRVPSSRGSAANADVQLSASGDRPGLEHRRFLPQPRRPGHPAPPVSAVR